MPKFVDLTNKRFARWKVLKRVENNKHNQPQYSCVCDCGKEKIVGSRYLVSNQSRSCGCYNSEIRKKICIERNTKHGYSRTKIHRTWCDIKSRCHNENDSNYRNYGAKGIKICARWLNSFENFLHDMGNPPTNKHTIDRIDNNKGYEPGNCRWVLMKAQQNNRTNNVRYKYNGKNLTLVEWSSILNIPRKTLYNRIKLLKWPLDKVFSEPSIIGKNQYHK